MARNESALSIMNRLPVGVRVPLALGTLIGANAVTAAPAEAHENYSNTPIGVSIEAAHLYADGHIKQLEKLLTPIPNIGMTSPYGEPDGKRMPWAEVKDGTAHIVHSWKALHPFEGSKEVEILAEHPTKGPRGLRGFCFVVKPISSQWKVMLIAPDANGSKQECGNELIK